MEARRHLLHSPSRTTMQAEALVILSSSPDFPSIDELLPKREKKPLLRSGSRAAPIPETALKSFTTASHFWQTAIAEEDESAGNVEGGAKSQQETRQIDFIQPDSPLRSVDNTDLAAETGPGPHIQSSKTGPTMPPVQREKSVGVTRPKAKPVVTGDMSEALGLSTKPKPRKKAKDKDPADGQTKIAKGKVTKPSATKPKQARKKAETFSIHFAAPDLSDLDDDPIDLEFALKRRTDWTPTKNTERPTFIQLDSSIAKAAMSPRPSDAYSSLLPGQNIFKNLRDTYSCADVEDMGRAAMSLEDPTDVLGKRKLIEMVTTSKAAETKTPELSPVKQKAPKKKSRTITELATAAYRVVDVTEDEEQSRDDSLLNYFPTIEELGNAITGKEKTVLGQAKGPKPGVKAKPKRASKKKAEPPQPILLSPESAMRQVSRQDFVFGTSSQLATEVDVGLLRDLQRAMRDSNRHRDHDPFVSSPTNNKVVTKVPENRLWGAGARDEDGDLHEVEVIDLVDSPAIEKDLTNPAVILSLASDAGKVDSTKRLEMPSGKANAISLSSNPTLTRPASLLSFTQNQTRTGSISYAPALHQSLAQIIELDEDPPASNQEQYHQMASSVPEAAPAPELPEVPAPKYDLYTDAQLAKEVQSYGFKPIKRRTAAIALLLQCWSSKNQSKAQTLGQNSTASLSTSSTAADKGNSAVSVPAAPKPRGRPKKSASVAEPLESVPASATVSAPEPAKRPRGRPRKEPVAVETIATKKISKATTKRSSLSPPPAVASESAPAPSTPKRRRKAPAQSAIEIADSDFDKEDLDPFALSSAASSPAPANESSSPVAGVDLSVTEPDESVLSLTSSPTSQQARLFKYITDAVRTAPRSTDPGNPSWHEKMLLYDPVVLEDLTAWLNGGQLDRVGYEEEVACGDVKKWCESKSVCCLWKVNINGKERKRF